MPPRALNWLQRRSFFCTCKKARPLAPDAWFCISAALMQPAGWALSQPCCALWFARDNNFEFGILPSSSVSIEMRLDTDEPIGAQFKDVEEMKRAMVRISTHTKTRGQQLLWANRLRFLTPDDFLISETEFEQDWYKTGEASEEKEEDCSCSRIILDDFSPRVRSLLLTSQDHNPECIHYVAVSYCWASTASSDYVAFPEEGSFVIKGLDGRSRSSFCPESLFERVTQFAAWKKVSYIWIDQECIIQDNVEDQTVGINAMDLVYEHAAYSLAVLEALVPEQRHLDALELLLDGDTAELEVERSMMSLCEALQIIMADPWFERAWCLQESASGNRSMTLLIRCSEDIDVPDTLWSPAEGCFELDLTALHDTLTSIIPFVLDVADGMGKEVIQEARDVVDLWFENMVPDERRDDVDGSATVCNAAQALAYLGKRKNSVVSDRLAILGNLCGYSVRLDEAQLDRLGFGFSVCALVLASLNGDFSLQLGYEDYIQTKRIGRKGELQVRQGLTRQHVPFSWSLPAETCLNKLSYLDKSDDPLRLTVCSVVLEHGLRIEGCLWISDRFLDLSALRLYCQQKNSREGHGTLRDFSDFLIQLLCILVQGGFSGLASLLWDTFRLRATKSQLQQSEEVVRYMKASLADVIDLKTSKVKWASPITSRFAANTHPFQSLDDHQGGATPRLDFIMKSIQKDGGILMSRPLRLDSRPERYAALFDVSALGSLVFAPKSNGEMKTPRNYGWYPSNWIVEVVVCLVSDQIHNSSICLSVESF